MAVQLVQGAAGDQMVTIAKTPIYKAEDHLLIILNACEQLYVPANSMLQLSIAEAKCITAEHIQSQWPLPQSNHWHHGSRCELHSTNGVTL